MGIGVAAKVKIQIQKVKTELIAKLCESKLEKENTNYLSLLEVAAAASMLE